MPGLTVKQRHVLSQEVPPPDTLGIYGFVLCLPYHNIKSMRLEGVSFPWLPRGLRTVLSIKKYWTEGGVRARRYWRNGQKATEKGREQRENHLDGRGRAFLCRLICRHPEGAAEIRANLRGPGCLWVPGAGQRHRAGSWQELGESHLLEEQ